MKVRMLSAKSIESSAFSFHTFIPVNNFWEVAHTHIQSTRFIQMKVCKAAVPALIDARRRAFPWRESRASLFRPDIPVLIRFFKRLILPALPHLRHLLHPPYNKKSRFFLK